MGGAIIRSLISAHFSVSAYFLTIQTYMYKRMHLTTQIYGTVAAKKTVTVLFCSILFTQQMETGWGRGRQPLTSDRICSQLFQL